MLKEQKTDLLQGMLDLLVLKVLSPGLLHGPRVSRRVERVTKGTFRIKPDSPFPALHRPDEAGWLKSSWGASVNNRRAKYYRNTKAGQRQNEDWQEDRNRDHACPHLRRLCATTAELIQPLA